MNQCGSRWVKAYFGGRARLQMSISWGFSKKTWHLETFGDVSSPPIFIWDRKISKFSRFSLDIATLVHHCSQSSNPITKWLGTVVHLHVEKLQLLYNRLCPYVCSPVTSGGGLPYNPCGFVTEWWAKKVPTRRPPTKMWFKIYFWNAAQTYFFTKHDTYNIFSARLARTY